MAGQPKTEKPKSPTRTRATEIIGPESVRENIVASTIQKMREEIPIEDVLKLLRDMMSATIETRSGTVISDNRARIAAITLYLAYVEGRPVERQEIVNVHLDGKEALERRLSESPQMIAALRKTLDQAASKLSKNEASVVTPVLNADESRESVRGETSSGEES